MGYAMGALAAGVTWAIASIGTLTVASGAVVAVVMREQMR